MLRALRIAAAVGCLLGCIAIGGLWVRSYSWSDGTWSGRPYASLYSFKGKVFIRFTGNPFKDPIDFAELWQRRSSDPLKRINNLYDHVPDETPWWDEKSFLGFACMEEPPGGTWIHFPLWAPLVASGLLGVAFAMKWKPRFSVRTVLIAMTLAAMFVGVIKMRSR